jgi:transposase InsO family protein
LRLKTQVTCDFGVTALRASTPRLRDHTDATRFASATHSSPDAGPTLLLNSSPRSSSLGLLSRNSPLFSPFRGPTHGSHLTQRVVDKSVGVYNTERLHSAIDYITPRDRLEGREAWIFVV